MDLLRTLGTAAQLAAFIALFDWAIGRFPSLHYLGCEGVQMAFVCIGTHIFVKGRLRRRGVA